MFWSKPLAPLYDALRTLPKKGCIIIDNMVKKHLRMLVVRLILFLVGIYFFSLGLLDFTNVRNIFSGVFLFACWGMLVVGMLYRVIPNKRISTGARRHFFNDEEVTDTRIVSSLNKRVVFVAVVWVVFNAVIFFVLHIFNILTPAVAILITLFYALCDVVFILFWCPFQTFFMKNPCCTECRIYNWDYAMMVTPLIIFPSIFTVSLILMAVLVLIRWEVAAYKNPGQFLQNTKKTLSCADCEDRLCHFKGRKNRV
ncbi:MAG: hypothetical protein FWF78_08960 [Defluviitaleaceae bacterium]|nr:hypothetical protein [Defluviitaleaceae bacterium]